MHDHRTLCREVADRYAPSGRVARHYVASKLRRDPVHRAVLQTAPDLGAVADIGCGRGQLSMLLLLAGRARAAVGIDRHRAHLGQAQRAASGLAFTPILADLDCPAEMPECDTAMLVDVLYQLAPDAQRGLLANAARAARQRVLIRTPDLGFGLRSRMTLLAERTALRFSPHSGARVAPTPIPDLAEMLHREGFEVAVTPCFQGTPFSNVLVSARRL
jgi:SAM-dependent methyltransferase